MKINNLPMTVKAWVVFREIDGENWFYGSWDDREKANAAALQIGGYVCREEEIES